MLNHQQLSYWERKTFLKDIDYIVIGAGIVGFSCAYHLKEKFPTAKVVVLERGYLPTGASSKNAGFACFGSPTELWDDLSHISEDEVWSTVEKRYKGLEYLRKLIGDDNLRFEQNGSWDLITDQNSVTYQETLALLPKLNRSLKEITGVDATYSEDREVSNRFGFKNIPTSFYNKLEAQIDTSYLNKHFYLKSLQSGVDVLFDHEVLEISEKNGKQVVSSSHGEINCRGVFITTNGLAKSLTKDIDVKPARAQVLITKPIEGLKIKGTFHYEMGYYYFRNIDNRILLGGGRNLDFEGETTDQFALTEQILNQLNELLTTIILPCQHVEIEHQWAGIMGVGQNKRPIIKELQPGVICGVRMGGMGVAIGSLVGKEMVELM